MFLVQASSFEFYAQTPREERFPTITHGDAGQASVVTAVLVFTTCQGSFMTSPLGCSSASISLLGPECSCFTGRLWEGSSGH